MLQGRDAEFDVFARAHMPSLLRFALLLTGNHADAEDLLQSSLARTLTSWSKVCRADRPDQYVRRVMVNAHAKGFRRAFRRRELTMAQLPDSSGYDDSSRIEDRSTLLDALSSLTKAQRAVVVLRYVEDHSESVTAGILGISVGTVKSQSHKGLARLREHPAFETDRSSS